MYTCSEHGKSVKQYARIVWASLISSLFPNVSTSSVQRRKLKKKSNFQLVFEPVLFLKTFSHLATLVSCFMIVLWLEINDVFLRFFLLFNSITSAVTACNVGVF